MVMSDEEGSLLKLNGTPIDWSLFKDRHDADSFHSSASLSSDRLMAVEKPETPVTRNPCLPMLNSLTVSRFR